MDKKYYVNKINELIKQAREDNIIIACYVSENNSNVGFAVFDINDNDTKEITLIPLI